MPSTTFITLYILLTSPHARHVVAAHLKSIPTIVGLGSFPSLPRSLQFRVGESRLVQWAQEDMSLGLIGEARNGEVDTMVNGTSFGVGDDDWNSEGLDEYIPLKSGTLRNPKDYGRATLTLRACSIVTKCAASQTGIVNNDAVRRALTTIGTCALSDYGSISGYYNAEDGSKTCYIYPGKYVQFICA